MVRIADQGPIQALFRGLSICFLAAGFERFRKEGLMEMVGWAERVNSDPAPRPHGLQSITRDRAKCGRLLRKCSPSGTEHVRITDASIFLICSKHLAPYLVPRRGLGTRLERAINRVSAIFHGGVYFLPQNGNEFRSGWPGQVRPHGPGHKLDWTGPLPLYEPPLSGIF
jgi:hypothetical protein